MLFEGGRQSCVVVGYLHVLECHSQGLSIIIIFDDYIYFLSGLYLVFLCLDLLLLGLETMLPLDKGVT